MKDTTKHIPVYSLQNFSAPDRRSQQFQVEVFDANRHFQVDYPHRHDFFEVLYLSQGSGFHIIDGNRYEISTPCVFFMSPGQAHKLELSADVEGYIFLFSAEFYLLNKVNQNRLIEFPFFFNILQENPPLLIFDDIEVFFIETLFTKALCELKKPIGFSIDLLRSILDTLLTSCENLYPKEEMAQTKGKGHFLVKRFYQLVEDNYKNNLTVNEYASLLAVTPNHLTQTIKQLTSHTSGEVIRSKQALEIKRLLVHTNLTISEIAHQLNFTDQSYFTKFFKRETGETPNTYRAKSMKNT